MKRPYFIVLASLLAGCDIFGLQDPDLNISLTTEAVLPQNSLFRVRIDGQPRDLSLGNGTAPTYSIDTHAPASGNLNVIVTLIAPSGDIAAETSFTQHFDNDDAHWVSGYVGTRRPVGMCMGTVIAVMMRPSYIPQEGDSLFVAYGSIPKGAIC